MMAAMMSPEIASKQPATTSGSDPYMESGGRAGAVIDTEEGGGDGGSSTPYVSTMEITGLSQAQTEYEKQRPYAAGVPGGDDDDDNMSMALSITSSVLSADGIHDVKGFLVVCLVILVGDMSRGVTFPTMWPLVESLGGSTVMLGYAVAAFSFGRILVNPLFGSYSETLGYRKTLLIACCILFIGSFMYAQVQNVGRPEFLIVAQTVLGIGSGTLGVTRAFVADVTAKRNRTTYMAWIAAVEYTGFTVTPFIGASLMKLLGDADWSFGPIRINVYTAPAYVLTLVVVAALYFLFFHFSNRKRIRTVASKKSKRRSQIDDVANTKTIFNLTKYDACIFFCMLLNGATKGSIASFETLGISYAETHFNLYSAKAGAIVASCGTLGVIILLLMGYLSARFTDVQLISGGMIVMGAGIASLTMFHEEVADEAANPTWRYVLAMFMIYTVGYPIGHTAVIGIFSKIVGKRPQGTLLGWFSSAGSGSRVIFPLISGYVAGYNDITTLFWILTGVLLTATICTWISRTTLSLLSS
eukprot:CAMPEP_0194030568 /NCGR_PEP_ID=MMETSP0009_2-20130614/3999_1 /TAXON_ID=210454 /ORGANISM="Grammatophora oceanica, Strain CCMP 410" /LENGTH=527 /DNA_ID=CAMNT_0038670533 /DNA_START=44 /DNA_END=1627 /DNA_ORIENTATION=-